MHVKLKKIMSSDTNPVTNGTTGVGKLHDLDERATPSSSHKQKFTKANLPFPGGGNHLHLWGKLFRPSLLSWAGSQEDPFGTNGMMHTVIVQIWGCVYPDIILDDQKMAIVVNVVRLLPLPFSKDSENTF